MSGSLAGRYRAVLERIAAAAGERPVTLVAVSKTHPIEAIEALYRLGQRDFGENYVQELAAKADLARERGLDDIRWHFIGHLQTNKARQLVPHVSVMHSVDSTKVARELAKRWQALRGEGERLPVFAEVNIDGEATKSGVLPADTPELCREISDIRELELLGLMAIPMSPESGAPTAAFQRLRELELSCRPHTRGRLSMGMTQDFEEAIRQGATHVRVGTAIFGKR